MTEWWTYSLRDLLMFSPQTYYRLFELYNAEMWPAHTFTISLGVAILFLMHRGGENSARWIAAILAAAWFWVAWAFHWQHYAQINLAANYFAWAFVAEALLLMWVGLVRNRLLINPPSVLRQRMGMGIFLFALFIHPLIGMMLGRNWTQAELFGMTPDPTALATLGLLLLANFRAFWVLAPIPLFWCLASGATLWVMDSDEFFMVPLIALLAVLISATSEIGAQTKPS